MHPTHCLICAQVLACHPDAVFATDGSGVIAYANPAAAKRAHADATRLTGTSFPNLLDQDSRRRFVAALRESEGAPPSTSISLGGPLQLMKNGALEVTVECAAAPRPDAQSASKPIMRDSYSSSILRSCSVASCSDGAIRLFYFIFRCRVLAERT